MAVNVGTLLVMMKADKSELIKGFKEGEKASKTTAQKISANFSKIGGSLTKFVSVPLAAAGLGMIKMGADLEETLSKTDVVFKSASKNVRAWGKTTLSTFGLAEQTALAMTSKYGAMATSIKFTEEAAADMGKEITGRVADLSSFHNISADIADTALTSIFTGETESLKQLGIMMTQVNLQQFALEQGMTKTIKEMTEAEKVSLRYAFVMDRTSNAAGDFARTSESVANQAKTAKEQIKQLAANFGTLLQPAAAKVLKSVNKLLESFNEMTPQGQKTILVIGGIAASIGPLLIGTSKLITAFTTIKTVVVPAMVALKAGTLGAGAAAGAAAPAMGAFGASVLAIAAPIAIVVAAVGAAVLIYRAFTKESREVEKANNELRDEMVETKTAFADNLTAAGKATENMSALSKELFDLSKVQNKSNADITKMNTLVNQLNGVIPTLKLNIDLETGALSKNSKEVAKNIKEQEKIGKVAAAEKFLIGVQADKIKIQERINELNDKYGEGTKKATKFTEQLTMQLGNLSQSEQALSGFLEENTQFLSANVAAQEEAAIKEAEIASERFETQKQFNEDVQAATEEHFDAMGSIYDEGTEQEKISLEKATDNLEAQVEQYQKWQDDLQAIASRVTPAILEQLQSLGVEGGLLVADLVNATDDELDGFVKAMEEKTKLAAEAAIAEVSGATIGMVQELEKTEDVKAAAEALGEEIPISISDGLNNNASMAYDTAANIANNIVSIMQQTVDSGMNDILSQSDGISDSTSQQGSGVNSVNNVNVNASGTIKIDGVNNKGELIESAELVSSSINQQLQFDMRLQPS